MSYQKTLDFLYTQLPMYQRQGKSAFKKDLTNIFALCKFLEKPELNLKCIHIAGTNGKGSTSHILSAIYQNNDYKVGLYTSPHLLDFRERIKINGKFVPKKFVVDFVKRIKPILDEIKPSFFEITVAMAFDYFAQQQVDIAIIETGLGGRLDSTNIIIPEISVITSISLDHMDMLGNTIEEIATEKAGIIKYGKPVVIGLLPPEAENVIREIAKERQALIYDAIRTKHRYTAEGLVRTDLKGEYQQLNIKTSLVTIDALDHIWPTEDERNSEALLQVCSLSNFTGRWQTLAEKPLIICDVAHNKEGLAFNINQLLSYEQDLHFILGFVNDKDLSQIINLFPKQARYSFVKPSVIRGLDSAELKKAFKKEGIQGDSYDSIGEAIEKAKSFSEEQLIYIGGSNFLVADALQWFNKKQQD